MPTILYIIIPVILIFILLIVSREKQRKIEKENDKRHTEEQLKFYKKEDKPETPTLKVSCKGKLIDMDEHFNDILGNEQ